LDPLELARNVVSSLEEKKGEEIILLDLQGLAPIGDYYVICSANNVRSLRSLLDSALDHIKEWNIPKPKLEGAASDGWLLADFGSVVLHVLSTAQREYYQLEDIWDEAKVLVHIQ
jgi:ribosome-associated protein